MNTYSRSLVTLALSCCYIFTSVADDGGSTIMSKAEIDATLK